MSASAIIERLNKYAVSLKRYASSVKEDRLLLILALVVGMGSGFAAVFLKNLIHFFQWILTGWFNTPVDSILYIFYPGLGMLMAMLFVRFIIKDNIGHGVTKVLLAVSKNESRIKSHNMWSSLVASSATIGFGGSVGAMDLYLTRMDIDLIFLAFHNASTHLIRDIRQVHGRF